MLHILWTDRSKFTTSLFFWHCS